MSYIYRKKLSKRCNYGSKRNVKDIKYFVFHYTANDGDTDTNNADYFHNNNVGASAHYYGDDDSITLSVPDDYIAWSVGSHGLLDQGSPYRSKGHKFWGKCNNSNSISFEMCDTKKDGKHNLSEKTRKNAIEFAIKKCKQYDIKPENIIRHFDVNGKLCPIYFVIHEDDWKDFKAEIVRGLESNHSKPKKNSSTSRVVLPKRGYFKIGDTGWKVKNLEIYLKKKGYYKGNIDSDYGPQMASATIKFEKNHKLKQDGMFGKNCLKYVIQ